MGRDASTMDNDDPLNYVSFDDYAAGASKPWTVEGLADNWNDAHPDDRVLPQGVTPTAPNVTPIMPDNCGTTRVFAALQLVGGGIELIVGAGALIAPEPTVTKVVGVVAVTHGVDTLQSAVRTIATCNRTATLTQQGVAGLAEKLGAKPETAQTIGTVTDVGIGVGTTFAIGALSRAAAGSTQLVHLTNANAAASIRGSQMLGLGRSTVYAGPEALANAKGWSILLRTGLRPAQATEAILLPSEAGESFLLVQPIGPMAIWQRISGVVFSAGTGSFNLATGAFTRSGVAVNQLTIYAVDSAIMTSLRAVPAIDRQLNSPPVPSWNQGR